MDNAFRLIKLSLIIGILIFILGFGFTQEFFSKIVKEAGIRLAPYGIEILHLR